MRPKRSEAGFSLTEMLVVMSVILILASILIVVTGEAYSRALEIKCQHNLTECQRACLLFQQANRALPMAWNNAGPNGTKCRWYDALLPYLGNNADVVACPLGLKAESSVADQRTSLPIYIVNFGEGWGGRCPTIWYHMFTSMRAFMTGRTDYLYPGLAAPSSFLPFPSDSNPGRFDFETGILDGFSQLWMLMNMEDAGQLSAGDLNAVSRFVQQGGGFHLFPIDPAYGESTQQLLGAVGCPVTVGGRLSNPKNYYEPSTHEVLAGISKSCADGSYGGDYWFYALNVAAAAPAQVIGYRNSYDSTAKVYVNKPGVIAFQSGAGYVLINDSLDSVCHYNSSWDHMTDEWQMKEYCVNAAKWLFGGYKTIGSCSYGYNNRLGMDRATVAGDTIVAMDYNDWEVDHDGKGSDHADYYVALRHGGRANAVFADGRVLPLCIADIRAGMWTPKAGD